MGRTQTSNNAEFEYPAWNGLILYFKTGNLDKILDNSKDANCPIEEEMHLNPNSTKMEFSLRNPNGYYWTITEYHNYEGRTGNAAANMRHCLKNFQPNYRKIEIF